jgi:hypothetical protein
MCVIATNFFRVVPQVSRPQVSRPPVHRPTHHATASARSCSRNSSTAGSPGNRSASTSDSSRTCMASDGTDLRTPESAARPSIIDDEVVVQVLGIRQRLQHSPTLIECEFNLPPIADPGPRLRLVRGKLDAGAVCRSDGLQPRSGSGDCSPVHPLGQAVPAAHLVRPADHVAVTGLRSGAQGCPPRCLSRLAEAHVVLDTPQ